ncbi:TsaA-like domain-containing protein [Haematococcus lacustris]|uniref:TsaA-like domain-containing protein n=1 Tax=Haematococcus lacustris TaxID=44745 RepID=A0A699Z3A8_HAELA|nr:TsaA-like domain-containing protein [Haematococcus lacustris]
MQAGVPGGQARGGCRPGLKAKVAVPRLNGGRLGVLATRSPHRPCPIGLSVAKVIAVEGRSVLLGGTDLVDGSPVLDLKPYVFCDAVPDACAPAWVKAEAEDEPLLVAAVEVDSLAAQALREGWQGRATRQPPPLTASADAFLELVSQVLARDIRSLHQRLHAPPPSSRPPLPSGGSAEKPGATVTTQQPPAGNAEPRCEADGPEFADPINPASDALRPTEEFTGATDPMGFYRVVLDGIEVSYDMDQSGKVQAAWRGCEETRIRVWQRCIAVHEEPTELGLPLSHVATTNTAQPTISQPRIPRLKCRVTPAGPATSAQRCPCCASGRMREMQCHSCLSGRRPAAPGQQPAAQAQRGGSGWGSTAAAPPQQQLTHASTTPELSVPAGAPPQRQQQREAPAANKSRAAKQGETTPRTAPSTLFRRSRAAGKALAPAAAPKANSGATYNSVAKRDSAARLAWGKTA